MNTPAPTTDSPNSRRRNRSTVLGVSAGLLAGSAIGLAATVPSFTSAASDDASADSTIVEQQEDTGDTESEPTADRPEAGERLRETLQPLVDDGTIDAAQADAVTEHLVENRPERAGRPGRRGLDGHGRNHAVVAESLGIDRETLRAELQAGQSIADIAEANGIDVQTVIDALIADAESHLDLAVEHGLDEELAADRLERVTERIEEGVYRTKVAADG